MKIKTKADKAISSKVNQIKNRAKNVKAKTSKFSTRILVSIHWA